MAFNIYTYISYIFLYIYKIYIYIYIYMYVYKKMRSSYEGLRVSSEYLS